jgi:glyoxylase-like metal-dependent hydrolase (beta-lactamase superfamily II)
MLEDIKLLSAGFCLHPEFMSIRGGGWRPCRFPAGFACLVHRRHGAILFDTGYSDHFRAETKSFPNALYARLMPPRFDGADHACDQLRRFGIDPADVRAIVVSHFHADHIAGLRDFPKARILCARDGYQAIRAARGLGGLMGGLLPGLMPADSDDRVQHIEELPTIDLPPALAAFGQGRDLFGDGTALAIALPGHSVGQIGLYIPDSPNGALFLVSDAAWSLDAITQLRPPPRVVTALTGQSQPYLATLAKLHHLHHAEQHLAIRPAHCSKVAA